MPTKTTLPARPSGRPSSMGSTLFILVGGAAALAALVVVVAVVAGRSHGEGAPLTTRTVEVEMGEFWFEPSTIEVAAGTELVVRAANAGQQTHDLKLDGERGTRFLLDGESEEVSLGVIERSTRAWCTVPGHLEAGMVMDIVVTP